MEDHERRHREREAQRLLDEPLLKEAFDILEKNAFEEILQTRGWWRFGQAKRAELIERVRVIRDVQSRLRRIIESGKAAQQNSRLSRVA